MAEEFKCSLVDREFIAHVVDVYDGDTATVEFNPWPADPNSAIWRFRIRLLGYDSEEMRQPRNNPNREQLREKARQDRAELVKLILNKDVRIVCGKFDSFGRILADVYVKDLHVNDHMIKSGHGEIYYRNNE